MKIVTGLLLLAVIVIMTGCAHAPGGIAPSTTPINGRDYRVIGKTGATDSHILLFGFLPIRGSNSLRPAINAAKLKCGADALIDVTVESYTQFWLILIRNVIRVEGLGIRFETRR